MIQENKLVKAFRFAEQKHKLQFRKGNKLPYMIHIYDVARILLNSGCNENTVIAGVLHDTLEDTQTTPAEISNIFGEEILQIVLAETENKALCWQERKQEKIKAILTASHETKKVKCADMLANMTDLQRDLLSKGEEVWSKFNASKEQTKWYYKNMIHNIKELDGILMYENLKSVYANVFTA